MKIKSREYILVGDCSCKTKKINLNVFSSSFKQEKYRNIS
jgi:hypothetical protein